MKRNKKVKSIKKIKPEVNLIGEDGNIYSMVGACASALRKVNQEKEAKEIVDNVFKATSYGNALRIMNDYVKIV